MSIAPFNRLVKLAARAFYDDMTMTDRKDNRGIAVVVLDALTRRQWVREEDLAKDLKLPSKLLRRILHFFEEEKLISREHRKETADDRQSGTEADGKIKMRTQSYCCLEYAQMCDVVRYRLHRMRKGLKDELNNKKTLAEYVCTNCGKRYDSFDAGWLAKMDGDDFHCEECTGKLAVQEMGDGARNRGRLEDLLRKMEVQLKPLTEQLNQVKDLAAPEFGSLQAWEARARAAASAAKGPGFGGTPVPFVLDTKVEVSFYGIEEKEESINSENANAPTKALPPWMSNRGMNLAKEQPGQVKEEAKMDISRAPLGAFHEKKYSTEKDDMKNIQDEYMKAYYAAILERQREQEEAAKREQQELSNSINTDTVGGDYGPSSERQVGKKYKHEDDDDGIDWEEG